jgi:carboxypeptidase PM20D1
MRNILMALILVVPLASGAQAAPHPKAEAEALDLAKKAIAMRSVFGPGNKTSDAAKLYQDSEEAKI